MGKESLHISPIHLSLLWSHGETRSSPLTFLGRTGGRADGQGYLSWELGRTIAVDGSHSCNTAPQLPEGGTGATTTSIVLLQKGQGGIYG